MRENDKMEVELDSIRYLKGGREAGDLNTFDRKFENYENLNPLSYKLDENFERDENLWRMRKL